MRVGWLPQALLASILVVVVVCAAFQPSPVTATDESAADADDGTITTTLYPGWNMVGWVGPETPASELFDDLPALGRIFAWDGEEQRYRQLMPSTGPAGEQMLLAPGDGLWLYIGGTSPVEWTREASEDSVLLELRAGRNLVPWAGRDGTPIEEATVRFGERLVGAWRWDAEAQEYRLFAPTAGLDQVQELNHGDALLVELTDDARWWQSGTAPVPVEILGDYTEREEWQIRGWVDGNRGFFAERWGVEAPVMTYAGDRESVDRHLFGGSKRLPVCAYDGGRNLIYLTGDCVNGGTHAHEYFHAIQYHLMGQPWKPIPIWIIEGSAQYVTVMYGATPHFKMLHPGHVSPSLTVQERIEEFRRRYEAGGDAYWPSLSETEEAMGIAFPTDVYYHLGFLGIAWLAEHAGDQSIVDFFAHVAGEPSWREAFNVAFGMSTDEFHERFDAYRVAAAPLLPHRTDGRDEPALEFVGDIPPDTQASFRAAFDRVQVFLRERFGAGPTDYTVYVVADSNAANEAHRQVFGVQWDRQSCEKQSLGVAAIISANCFKSDPGHGLTRSHFEAARALTVGAHGLRGPQWLLDGSRANVVGRYEGATGRTSLETFRRGAASNAARTDLLLSDLEGVHAFRAAEPSHASAVSILAVDRLLQGAGDRSLFDYYRQLGTGQPWREAFEGAFGLTADNFYRQFEAYRAEFAHLTDALPTDRVFPHQADDRNEPVLVFVGDITAHTRQAVSDEFASVQAFFSEHFGTGTADYTLYIAADDEAVGEPYLLVHGRELIGGFCSSAYGIAAIVDVSCYTREGLFGAIAQSHMLAVRDRLAAVSPPLRLRELGLDFGPNWLNVATPWYGSFVYAEAAGLADYEVLHQSQVSRARQVARPLSSMATRAGFSGDDYWNARGVAILAVEWLTDRAGDPAIFEYYRLLPGSETWEEAFEAAFGIAVDEFYEQFEAYRARVAPPNEDADSS